MEQIDRTKVQRLIGEESAQLAEVLPAKEPARGVDEDDAAQGVPCGPDPEHHLRAIAHFAAAGFDQVYVHQVGPDQEGFFRFYAAEILPLLDPRQRSLQSRPP